MLVEVYHYPDDSNTDVTVVGKTSVSDIPLPDVTNTSIQVVVATITNRAVNPPRENFTTTECNTRELNSTTTTTTYTTITSDITFVTVIATTAISTVPTVAGTYICMYVHACIHTHICICSTYM